MKKQTIRELVKEYLTIYDEAKDSDAFLSAYIWDRERRWKYISNEDFLLEFSRGKFTSSETIRRHRQKLQELNPNLRGEKYKLRKEKLEQKYREEFSLKNNK